VFSLLGSGDVAYLASTSLEFNPQYHQKKIFTVEIESPCHTEVFLMVREMLPCNKEKCG
jgi:hypothetical protein